MSGREKNKHKTCTKKFYFAYGSNMSRKDMKRRCPDSEFVKTVYLEGYRFVYDGPGEWLGGALANIVKDPKGKVWGALFLISEEDEKKLDIWEDYPHSYKKAVVDVKDAEGNTWTAMVYLRPPRKKGVPSEMYMRLIVNSARELGLPEEYIRNFLIQQTDKKNKRKGKKRKEEGRKKVSGRRKR